MRYNVKMLSCILSSCMFVICLSFCLSIDLSGFVCLSVCESVCLSICHAVCLSVCTLACLAAASSHQLSLYVVMSVCLSVCLSYSFLLCPNLSVCLLVRLSSCLQFSSTSQFPYLSSFYSSTNYHDFLSKCVQNSKHMAEEHAKKKCFLIHTKHTDKNVVWIICFIKWLQRYLCVAMSK